MVCYLDYIVTFKNKRFIFDFSTTDEQERSRKFEELKQILFPNEKLIIIDLLQKLDKPGVYR